MTSVSEFDVAVLGLGPGGEDVATVLAKAGRSALGVDERLVGGECPYFGCIPTKMMLRGAEVLQEARRVPALAGEDELMPDWRLVAKRIRDEATDDWDDRVAVERLQDAGVSFARGTGRIAGRDDDGVLRVRVAGETYRARHVVVATGTAPALPPIDGLADLRASGSGADGPVWTNREAVQATEAPRSLIVIGGGPIGCELAQAFERFGTRVSVVQTGPRLLPREEPEAAAVLADVFAREGIEVHTDVQAVAARAGGEGVELELDDGTVLTAAQLLVAAGRTPNLRDIGLDSIGLDPSVRALTVDDHMQVQHDGASVDGLFAVGDIAGHGAFTHLAMWQAGVLERHLLGEDENFGGYDALAWTTFTDPEVGHVGMTEQEARDAGMRVRTGTAQYATDTRGWIHGAGNDGFVKVVEDADRGVLVGATSIGPNGGEVLAVLTLAVHAKVPVRTMLSMHYVFPTLHRTVLEALQTLK